jgi:hypothetical protein
MEEAPDDLRPRLIAAATIGVVQTTLQHGSEERARGNDPTALLDYGFTFLTEGSKAIKRLEKPAH